jgi:nickel transport protein
MKRVFPSLVLVAALSPAAALAHGVWLQSQHGELAVVYGHGAEQDSYDPAKVTSVMVCPDGAGCTAATPDNKGSHVTLAVPEAPSALVVEFDNGFWSKDANGEWHNQPKDAVAGATEGGQYLKHAVYLTGPVGTVGTPLGQTLEIVPLADPFALKMGDALEVQVLFNGAPFAGAELVADYVNDTDAAPVVADAEGKAIVPLRHQGLNVLAVSHAAPHADPAKADETGHTATLSFMLGHAGE